MLKSYFLLFCLMLGCFYSFGQSISPERLADWSSAGPFKDYPIFQDTLYVLDFDADPTGTLPSDDALDLALQAKDTLPTVLFFPKGKFLFQRPIVLPSHVQLTGAGAVQTQFIFNLLDNQHPIQILGELSNESFYLSKNAYKGQTEIQLTDLEVLKKGDWIYLQLDDSDLVTSNWALGSVGQINHVVEVRNRRVVLENPLRMDFPRFREARAVKMNPIINCAIQGVTIVQLNDNMDNPKSNIFISNAVNIRLQLMESSLCQEAHVLVQRSAHVSLSCSYLHRAHGYGNGGQGYGVVLQGGTGDCLIENNIFDSLRHSVLLQSGANGNVIAYNFSENPYWEDVLLPPDAAGDLVLHGNFPFGNLIENNVFQNMVIDDSHGKNGPFNTFFRNRALRYGFVMSNNPPSDSQNIMANVIQKSASFPFGGFLIQGSGHYLETNLVNGNLISDSFRVQRASYFYADTPSFLINHPFPTFEPYAEEPFLKIPAFQRFEKDSMLVDCAGDSIEIDIILSTNIAEEDEVVIFPNPARNTLHIKSGKNSYLKYQIFSVAGEIVRYGICNGKNEINLIGLENGFYFLKLEDSKRSIVFEKFIKL